ncbi:MAG: S8 family serine peptidase [Ferruginibacter sp.]
MKILMLLLFLFTTAPAVFAQPSRYIIQLKDKAGTPFSITNPLQFLSQRSVGRRLLYNIPVDETDLPVNPLYLDSIRLSGNLTILNVSKWLNQVCIQTTDSSALGVINTYSFVLALSPVAARTQSTLPRLNKRLNESKDPAIPAAARPLEKTDVFNYGAAFPQVSLHNTQFLHNHGFRGEGMQLAIMDAGFYHYTTLPTFDSARRNAQVLGTWDFVANEASVDEDNPHGMNCLSTIAANLPGTFVGTSPKSSFYLFRTEDVSGESPIEEQNWVAAAEKADSLGVNVFSVSLGYNQFDNSVFNYAYPDMDGNVSMISRAADLAAKKGILVAVAAGNYGNSSWKYITTPADADSVLTIGAVNSDRQIAGFSSYGPSADGQIKPDVAAIGLNAVIADQNTGNPTYGNGTSYACPIMTGMVTCLWQAFPEANNMGIIDVIRKSSDRSAMPDNRTGYGIPDAKKAFVLLIKKLFTQKILVGDSCSASIAFTIKGGLNMNIVIERKLPADINYLPVNTTNFTGPFTLRDINYRDDLATIPAGTAIKYRWKMNIAADTSFYLDSATVMPGQTCGGGSIIEGVKFGPNPVKDDLTVLVTGNSPLKTTVKVFSITGQQVYTRTQEVNGVQQINVPMKKLSRGLYFVSVFINDKKAVVKKVFRD